MCGICGYVSSSRNTSDLGTMNRAIKHRGPDAAGQWNSGKVGLAHSRLSIIDLSERGNQPFQKNGYVIVFNGEIYNFKELRDELNTTNFCSDSDTEVILELWRRDGPSCLSRLRGMFSLAIHEKLTGKTFVARDHFGIKPLFYYQGSGEFVFSSELKALEAVLDGSLTVDRNGIVSSLLYVWIPEQQSVYKEVKKLTPGSFIEISKNGNVTKSVFWDSRSLVVSPPEIVSEPYAIEYLGNILESSVKAHLVSDVPVNAFLSGGLDSSLIVSMARKYLPELDCYTIKFSEADKRHEVMADDAFYAEKVAKELDVRLTTIEVKPDLAQLLPKIAYHLDEPIGDSAAINTFLICDAARKAGVKVLLSGMGADEMFAGYRKYYANVLAKKYRIVPHGIRRVGEALIDKMDVVSSGGGNKLIRWAKRFVSFAGFDEADAFFRSYTYYDLAEIERGLYDKTELDVGSIQEYHHELFNYGKVNRDLVDAMCYTDINHFMVSLNLTYSDRASMAASTEVRVPFIDREVIKAAFKISSSLKLKYSTQKYILKKLAEKWLPKDVIYRPKSSFTMPLRAWIHNDLTEMVDDYLLSDDGLSGRKLLKPDFIKTIVDEERAGKADNAQKIWHLLTLEQWLRNKGI